MTDSLRDEVRACVARATTGALADIEAQTDAIMAKLTAKPAPVVGDDAVERAVDVFEREVAKEQDYNPLHAGITNAVIMHKVLTAALSQGEG